ncbi:hypothetical protein PsYK624_078720 [Phanerochaete sordida]|uniref:Uncharacterized protein n=1 Tax=Phanerochaete sordida TaxID=48140 RepID=A0A9P3LF69_9APHY|nr:hypothetical protein PsYK624_078720 [Phanerochaete sordida]
MQAAFDILGGFNLTYWLSYPAQIPSFPVPMQGTVFWKPVFEYDNSENDGTITFRKTLSFSTTFTARVFASEVNEAIYRYATAQQSSTASLDLTLGLGSAAFEVLGAAASQENTTTTEFDSALRLVREHAAGVVQTTVQSTEQTYTVGPRSRLNLYQKVFHFAGLDHECDAVRVSPRVLRESEAVDVVVRARPVAFVKDIQVVYGDCAAEAPPLRVVEVHGGNADINAGFGGKYVWLVPLYTFDPAEAASRFDLIVQEDGYGGWPDLAKGAGGQFRFLRAVHDPRAHVKIRELAFLRSGAGAVGGVEGWGFSGRTEDINRERQGDWLYLMWKTHAVPEPIL